MGEEADELSPLLQGRLVAGHDRAPDGADGVVHVAASRADHRSRPGDIGPDVLSAFTVHRLIPWTGFVVAALHDRIT
jgi:hypothetical protein